MVAKSDAFSNGSKVPVVVMQDEDYREPSSFIYDMGSEWDDFLKRWNDPNITTDEAKGLLHTVADRLWWADTAPQNIGEDSRETCVRFLLHYANHTIQYDNEGQIIHKARQVLITKTLKTRYMREEATDGLVVDILTHFIKYSKDDLCADDRPYYDFEPYQRKTIDFLKMVDEARNSPEINDLVDKLIVILFRGNKNTRKNLCLDRKRLSASRF
ncbi:hypothetical protein MYX07_04420 [Patescibacteria group bacterium AH-259-L07]|nr:hypothetical protein [Patescibacteria group bacterium AH-259-L07]